MDILPTYNPAAITDQSTACQTKAVYTPPRRHAEIRSKINSKMGLFKSRKSKHNQSASTSSTEQSPSQSSSQSQTQQQIYTTHRRNLSTSNLSTTSTLTDEQTKPSQNNQPTRPQSPARMTSYEAFLYHAQLDERRKEERRKAQEHAWKVAAQRRAQSNMWPVDSWRGGFGPPSRGTDVGGQAVEGWLRGNGLRN